MPDISSVHSDVSIEHWRMMDRQTPGHSICCPIDMHSMCRAEKMLTGQRPIVE